MTKQQGKKKSPVILAVGFLTLALIAFGAVFYYFDGMSVVDSFLGTDVVADSSVGAVDTSQAATSTVTIDDGLRLPDGMSEDAALRIWQEQVDSQANIVKLLSGDVDTIVITGVEQDGDTSTLSIRAQFADDTSANGVIGMKKYGEYWFFEYVTGLKGESDSDSRPDSVLPDVEDVDIDVLNTIIAQQVSSADVLTAYADGDVEEIVIGEVADGPGTKTLAVAMTGSEGQVTGDVVAISRDAGGKSYWLIAKFTKS